MLSRFPKSPRGKFVIVALTMVVVIQLFAVVVSGLAARGSSIAVAKDAISRDGDMTIEAILRHLDPAEQSVEITAQLLGSDLLPTGQPDLEHYLYAQLAVMPQMTGAFIGYPDRSFVFVSADGDGDGFTSKRITMGEERTVVIERYDREFVLISTEEQFVDTYDPTERPWYTLAISESEIAWTEPYLFFTLQSPGVTASKAVRVDGEVVAVVGVDVELSGLANFLDESASTESSEAFVMSGDVVVAAPSRYDGRIEVDQADSVRLMTATELGISGAEASSTDVVSRISTDSGHELVMRRPFPKDQSLGWDVIMRAPENDFTSVVAGQQRLNLLVSVGGGLLVLLAFAILWRISHPINELHVLASTDPLTGLANRREISEAGARLLDERSPGTEVAVLTLDLDGFKALNDDYGHEAGDRALVGVADCLAAMTPEGGLAGRLGGDEFVVAYPVSATGAGVTSAKRILIALRERLAEEFPVARPGVTGGIAVSTEAGDSFASLVGEADHALITGKVDSRGLLQLADQLVTAEVDNSTLI